MMNRRSVPPALLQAPAPTDQELKGILTIASRVPDHGVLVPWRFILVKDRHADDLLAEFLQAHAAEEQEEVVHSWRRRIGWPFRDDDQHIARRRNLVDNGGHMSNVAGLQRRPRRQIKFHPWSAVGQS
ncbi:nitroreductase family protein [Rhizobium herbae]|nr:nitroreductase family protein [Rhizobium herbae]